MLALSTISAKCSNFLPLDGRPALRLAPRRGQAAGLGLGSAPLPPCGRGRAGWLLGLKLISCSTC
jgi:hypothetical protein